MEWVRLEALPTPRWPAPVVTVGNFDGVHRGHQALVREAVAGARSLSGTAVVLTFDPHPARILSPDRAPSALMTLEQKAEALADLGVDRLVVLTFTRLVAQQTPDEFARKALAEALGARLVVVGSSFRFGQRRAGDLERLRALGQSLGFGVQGLDPVGHEGGPISSSRIREVLAQGAVDAARELLGREFFVDGRVVPGDGRGRTIGIPTANLDVVNETLPRPGVYACRVRTPDGALRPAVVNRGTRPTFGGERTILEAHLLDFERDLYGAFLRVHFVARLRDERKFGGPEELLAQIRTDVAEARRRLGA